MLRKNFKLKIPSASLNALPTIDTELQPFVSPAYEDVPIWNILPSYQLYELTFSKKVVPELEDFQSEPPNYEIASPLGSFNEPGSYFPPTGLLISPTHSQFDSSRSSLDISHDSASASVSASASSSPSHLGQNREATFSTWENSILANAHLLDHLSDLDKIKSDKIMLQIHFTSGPGASGRESVAYDPLNKEFLQGDQLYGYVVLENLNSVPVMFDMFLVVFEGRVSVNVVESDARLKPVVFYKFLNMFDYSASWSPAYFDAEENKRDPRDGTHLQFDLKALEPGIKYKRFFNFTVPDCLLDCACGSHQIPRHCQLPPSLGLDKKSFLQRLRQQRDTHVNPIKLGNSSGYYMHSNESSSSEQIVRKLPIVPLVRDFSFSDTSINYCVEARLVGKRSAYQKGNVQGSDKFIIVKENGVSLRIIPREMGFLNEDDTLIHRRFESFCTDIERIISRGHKLDSGKGIEPTRRSSTVKQVYGSNIAADRFASNNFEVLMPYKKKSLTQSPKVIGMLRASFSRKELIIGCISPPKFSAASLRANEQASLIILPVSLEFVSKEDPKFSRPPEIKGVSAKVVICTVRSSKYPIPVELSQKMKFDNSLMLKDEFEKNVVEKFSKYLAELSRLITKHGHTKLEIDHRLMMDVKCLANLQVKSDCLKISADYIGGLPKWSNADNSGVCHNQFKVAVNFNDISHKDTSKQVPEHLRGALSLVPSFESCIVVRFYFVLVELKLANGDTLPLKVPVRIQR